MFIELLAVGIIGKAFYDVDQSMKIEEEALETYSEAYEIKREAYAKIREMREFTDKRLQNVVKKKRAVITYTIPRFVEVYGKIQKIEIQGQIDEFDLFKKIDIEQKVNLKKIETFSKEEFTNQELLFGIATKGIAKMMKIDSERELSAAKNQLNAASTLHEQSESTCVVYEAIVNHADRISKLIVSMNVLFLKSIEQTEITISNNGFNVRNYNEYDKGVLMTCVNLAKAMMDVLSIQVVDKQGNIYKNAVQTIEVGENYLEEINKIIK